MKNRYTDIRTGNDLLDESLENYLLYGLPPGGFLSSVIANDLHLAIVRADHQNLPNLSSIVNEVVHRMPYRSIGSYDIIEEWCRDSHGLRSEYRQIKEKEFTFKSLKGNV